MHRKSRAEVAQLLSCYYLGDDEGGPSPAMLHSFRSPCFVGSGWSQPSWLTTTSALEESKTMRTAYVVMEPWRVILYFGVL